MCANNVPQAERANAMRYTPTVEKVVARSWRGIFSSRMLTLDGWIAFDIPRTVSILGGSFLAGLAAAHVYLLGTERVLPPYFLVYSVALIIGCLVATGAMAYGANAAVAQRGWYIGSTVCLLFLVAYVISRLVTLPGLPELTGRWDIAPGTFAMAFAGGFIALHTTVLSGINVAYPNRQGWYD